MAVTDDLTLLLLVVGAAFVPPLIYLVITRNTERHDREPWGKVFNAFFYGAFASVLIAILLSALFQTPLQREYTFQYGDAAFAIGPEILMVIVIAPVVEEFSKGLGIRGARRHIMELEDGIVYGVAAGLGFSATENLIYEVAALLEHQDYTFLVVAALRSITSTFLHATASGLLGYGMAKRYLQGGLWIEVLPFYALAVLLHASFNTLAVFQNVGGVPLLAFLFILTVSIVSIRWTLARITRLDQQSMPAPYLR